VRRTLVSVNDHAMVQHYHEYTMCRFDKHKGALGESKSRKEQRELFVISTFLLIPHISLHQTTQNPLRTH
jgi:hypothetical protein